MILRPGRSAPFRRSHRFSRERGGMTAIRAALVLSVACATPCRPGNARHRRPRNTTRARGDLPWGQLRRVDAFVTDAQGTVTNLTAADLTSPRRGQADRLSFAMVNSALEPRARSMPRRPSSPTPGRTRRTQATWPRRCSSMVICASSARGRDGRSSGSSSNRISGSTTWPRSCRPAQFGPTRDFTNNPRLLLKAIDRSAARCPFAPWRPPRPRGAQSTPADPAQQEEAQRARMLIRHCRSPTLAGCRAGGR